MPKTSRVEEINLMEQQLQATLRPLKPTSEYKDYLHDRLVIPPSDLRVQQPNLSPWYIVLAAIGLTGSVVLLITAIKALVMYSQSNQRRLYPRSFAR